MKTRTYLNKWNHKFKILGFNSADRSAEYLLNNPSLYFNTSAHGFAEMHFDKSLSLSMSSVQAPFLVDGIWALSFFRPAEKSVVQIPGWDLVSALLPKLDRASKSVHVVGASDTVLDLLKAKYPAIKWSYYTGMLDRDSDLSIFKNEESFCTLVALGSPKQDVIALRLFKELKSKQLIIPVGIALAMNVGEEAIVPRIYTQFGLSWLHRFIKNPNKMTSRIVMICQFLVLSKTLNNVVPFLNRTPIDGRK